MILATPRQLFRTYFDAEKMKSWRVPDGATGTYSVLEPQPGGRFCLNLLYSDRAEIDGPEAAIDIITGTFTEFLTDERVVEAIRYTNAAAAYSGMLPLPHPTQPP